jgi:TPR repeat protein
MRRSSSCLVSLVAAGLLSGGVARADGDARAACLRNASGGAYKICERAVEAAPHDPILRRLYGLSLSHAGGYERAIEQYRRATELAPDDPVAQFEYAWMLAFVRRYADAVAPIERAIALKPDDRRALKIAAIIYAQQRRAGDQLRVVLAAARLGDRIAMFDAYDLHRNGIGTPRNEAVAFEWLRRAAQTGHVGAMDRLIDIYLNGGLGQPQDLKAAARWATRARAARLGG